MTPAGQRCWDRGELTVHGTATQNVEHLAPCWPSIWPGHLLAPAGDIELLASRWLLSSKSRSFLPETPAQGASTDLALSASRHAWEAAACADRFCLQTTGWNGCNAGTVNLAQRPSHPRHRHAPSPGDCPCPPGCWMRRCGSWNATTGRTTRDRCNCSWAPTAWKVAGGTAAAPGRCPALNVQRDYWLHSAPCGRAVGVPATAGGDQTAWFLHGHFA